MRRLDDYPIDPEIALQLDAIDATLAGEPVDPEYAELAELALMLAAERPEIGSEFARSLDRRVQRRFAPAPDVPVAVAARRRRAWKPIAGTLAGGLAAIVAVFAVTSGGGGSSSATSTTQELRALPAQGSAATASTAASSPSQAAPNAGVKAAPSTVSRSPATAAGAGFEPAQAFGASAGTPAPQPQSNGRRIVQSAQLALSAAPNRIDQVGQEAFDVIGRESGIVNRSTVTATGGSDGYAEFQLRVPSAALGATMTALSELRYAHVSSRTDSTQDVNDAYVSVSHRLADARALRTALLKQLANAVTQQQIDSVTARIHDVEASIASDQATLRNLNGRIDYSQITLTINAAYAPVPASHSSGSFTIGKAAHDAGRVLTVAAGVALITLAALVPLTLVGALAWWIAAATRRRRREQALDAA
jgi:hypothetical protein